MCNVQVHVSFELYKSSATIQTEIKTFQSSKPTMIKIVLLLSVFLAVVSASGYEYYEPSSYYASYYSPIYQINNNGKGGRGGRKRNSLNDNVIRNGYSTGYGSGYGSDDYDYGKGGYSHPSYNANYYSCVSNIQQNGRKNHKGISDLLGGNGCNGQRYGNYGYGHHGY